MKNYMKVKNETRELVMDKTFAKNASYVGTREYAMLQAARKDYPEYTVVTRSIQKKENKESYKGLTYKYIEDYIACHANSAERMKEYKEMRLLAECHSVRFPHIKNWFLETYPEVKQFGVRPIKEQETNDVREIKAVELQVA